jgi:hypothetical protein
MAAAISQRVMRESTRSRFDVLYVAIARELTWGRLRIKRRKPKRRRSSLLFPPADLTAYDPTPDPTDLLGLKGTAAGRYVGLYHLGDFLRGRRSREQLRRYQGKSGRDPWLIFLAILTGLALVTIVLGWVVPGR